MNTAITAINPADHPIVSKEQWLAARKTLLAREKELTRLQDEIARERRTLPWVRVEKDYVFDTLQGPRRLADLFDGRGQLLVQHFMFAPGWEQGCKSCSYMADHNDGANIHLAHRDVTLLAVSRAPLADIERFRQRMGWRFNWVSSLGSDFNRDFAVSFSQDELSSGKVDYNYVRQSFPHEEAPGLSVFCRDEVGQIFHTYSRYGRGVEVMMHTNKLIEQTPFGREEYVLDYPIACGRHHERCERND
ncbi:DUF899 domain-containing protein, partial [Lysobacter sp. 2RAB21]